ncbi:hypothetical protein ACHHYP_02325 [Achlya hypogyna]|uniref:GH16 domain-containing protein n=1 Tax=Achlya hypogyna TaxID=1202772 RepID=A0A1V9Z6X2_ACHHY|nr:hypothetical protein ACHHYP_02325 [Achlya hypogyna]
MAICTDDSLKNATSISTIMSVPNVTEMPTIDFPNLAWHLTFEDNFETLDRTRWSLLDECSTQNGCVHNAEEQVYLSSQVRVEAGSLVLEATNESHTSVVSGTRQYRSGKVDSAHFFAQQYGRFEARIKLPVGRGMLMPHGGRCWPTDGEIDIMEYVGQFPNHIHGNYHFGPSCNHNLHDDQNVCGVTGKPKKVVLNDAYHIYAVEWTPTSLVWFFDGQLYYKLDSSQCKNKKLFFIPNKPFYIIFNLAVGGSWPGSPTAATIFPQRMYVDYVRVYKQGISHDV